MMLRSQKCLFACDHSLVLNKNPFCGLCGTRIQMKSVSIAQVSYFPVIISHFCDRLPLRIEAHSSENKRDTNAVIKHPHHSGRNPANIDIKDSRQQRMAFACVCSLTCAHSIFAECRRPQILSMRLASKTPSPRDTFSRPTLRERTAGPQCSTVSSSVTVARMSVALTT